MKKWNKEKDYFLIIPTFQTPAHHKTHRGPALFFPFKQNLAKGIWEVKTGFICGKQKGLLYGSGWLGPRTAACPADPRAKRKQIPWLCSSLICVLRRGGGPGPWAREELQEGWGGAGASSVRGMRGGGDLRGRLLPWAARTYTCKLTWEIHTHTHHGSPRGRTQQQSNYNATAGSNKVQPLNLTMEWLIVNAFQELLQHGSMCMFAGGSQSFYWLERKAENNNEAPLKRIQKFRHEEFATTSASRINGLEGAIKSKSIMQRSRAKILSMPGASEWHLQLNFNPAMSSHATASLPNLSFISPDFQNLFPFETESVAALQ